MTRDSIPPAELHEQARANFKRTRDILGKVDPRNIPDVEKSLERSIERLKRIPRKRKEGKK